MKYNISFKDAPSGNKAYAILDVWMQGPNTRKGERGMNKQMNAGSRGEDEGGWGLLYATRLTEDDAKVDPECNFP